MFGCTICKLIALLFLTTPWSRVDEWEFNRGRISEPGVAMKRQVPWEFKESWESFRTSRMWHSPGKEGPVPPHSLLDFRKEEALGHWAILWL